MLLLSWHGTILRVGHANRRLTHAPLWPIRDVAADFGIELQGALTQPLALRGGLEMLPGPVAGTVHISRRGKFLTVLAEAAFPAFEANQAGDDETLLLVPEADMATLRRLVSTSWRCIAAGLEIAAGEVRIGAGFTLAVAPGATVQLLEARPAVQPDGLVRIEGPEAPLLLEAGTSLPTPAEWHLRTPDQAAILQVQGAAALQGAAETRMALAGEPERSVPPIAICRADRDWPYRSPHQAPQPGPRPTGAWLVHAADRHVVLQRGLEGVVFNRLGADRGHPALGAGPDLPACMAREAGQAFIDPAALTGAPVLRGPHMLCFDERIADLDDWAARVLPGLAAARALLPPGTALLLPAAFRDGAGWAGHRAALHAAGCGGMPISFVADAICLAEDLYWLDCASLAAMPAAALHALRQDWADRPSPRPRTRLYLHKAACQPGTMSNNGAIDTIVANAGFVRLCLDDIPVVERPAHFAAADFIIGQFDTGSGNLMACLPGTKIIELAGFSTAYQNACNLICGKLGLAHAIMTYASPQSGANADIVIDPERFQALLQLMQARL